MPRDVGHILDDILETIDRLQAVASGKTLAEFENDWQLRFIVQRGIEIISEASRHLPSELKSLRPEIPWDNVKNIGNVLRHEYQKIADPLIWRVVIDELPRLKIAIVAMRDSRLRN